MHAGHSTPTPAQKRSVAAALKPRITEVAPALGPRFSPSKRPVDVQNTVLNTVGDTCDTEISVLDVNADLGTCGVDSLMSIENLRKFEESFPQMQFDANIFGTCNITELVREISSTVGSQAASVINTPETAFTPEPTLQGDASQSTNVRSILLELISSFKGFEISTQHLNADVDTAYDLLFIPLFNNRLQTFFPDVTLDPTKPSVCSTLLDEVTAQVQAGPSSSSPDLVDTKPMFVSVLGLDESDIPDNTEFETIGLHSLIATETLHAIQTKFSLGLPSNLFKLHTMSKAANQYISSKRPGKSPKPVEETAMDPNWKRIFWSYSRAGQVCCPGFVTQPSPYRSGEFWGFNNPNHATDKLWPPLTLTLPWSLGGLGDIVGFEAARQLMRRGVPVKGVVLIDAPFPVDHVPSSNEFMTVISDAFPRGGRPPTDDAEAAAAKRPHC
ncbi:hypothetical protein EDD85DRAFT_1027614 [Armillaria nabsnona]|nr:hypothetical protein EDD85DRAFT_1027614 [Armillaria nabsnona]